MKNHWMTCRVTQLFLFGQKSQYVSTYARPFSALSFRLKGKSVFYGKKGEKRTIDSGTVLLVPAGVAYERQCVSDEEIIVFHFISPEFVGGEILAFHGENMEAYRMLFERALTIWEKKEAGYQYAVTACFYEILAKFYRDTASQEQGALSQAEQGAEMMQKEFSSPTFTIASLAKRLYVSEVYLRRIFRATYGMSPKQYLDDLRMEHAKVLLESRYYSQQEIAQRCGYDDVKYFRTAFKRHTGKTPGAYMKEHL